MRYPTEALHHTIAQLTALRRLHLHLGYATLMLAGALGGAMAPHLLGLSALVVLGGLGGMVAVQWGVFDREQARVRSGMAWLEERPRSDDDLQQLWDETLERARASPQRTERVAALCLLRAIELHREQGELERGTRNAEC